MKASRAQLRAWGVQLPPDKHREKRRGMNRTEAEYAKRLEALKAAGQISWYGWEAVKLRLADRTWYTPDFMIMHYDGTLSFAEVKGFMRDDAAVKIKVAAELYPWRFVIVRKTKGGWEFQEVPGRR